MIIIGVNYLSWISDIGRYGGVPTFLTVTGYLVIVVGFGSIIYGAKRLIDDVIKATR